MSTTRKREGVIDVETRIFLVKSSVRRELISVVAEHGEITLRSAAEHIAAKKEGVDVDEITYHDQKGIYSMAAQNHVPTLEEHGIIETDDNVLQATDVTHDVAELIDLLGDVEIGGARA